jgi:hypothetical protein
LTTILNQLKLLLLRNRKFFDANKENINSILGYNSNFEYVMRFLLIVFSIDFHDKMGAKSDGWPDYILKGKPIPDSLKI